MTKTILRRNKRSMRGKGNPTGLIARVSAD